MQAQQGVNPNNIDFENAQVAYDEQGQPFIILREQQKQSRVRGLAAHKANIQAARAVITPFFLFLFLFLFLN